MIKPVLATAGLAFLLGACQTTIDGVPTVTAATDDVTLTISDDDNHALAASLIAETYLNQS